MSIQEIRDNLTVGITLADNYPHGLELNNLLVEALGYTPGASWPIGDRDYYISRLRSAQRIGERKYVLREAGYFTINAMPFGNIFVYKAPWYTWLNPETGNICTVPTCITDLTQMRRWRERYLATRTRSTRSIQTADNIIRRDKAIARGDSEEVQNIHSEMIHDGTMVELITGLLGIPYLEVPNFINTLAQANPYGNVQYEFTRRAQQARDLERRLLDLHSDIVGSLSRYIHTRQGLPPNARQLALQDARDRLADL